MIPQITEQTLPLPPEYIEQLKATEQNPRFHAEGNVYNHTLLVLQQFEQKSDEFDLTEEEREILYWAVVLHDIGKPSVTTWRDGRWRATGHEEAGVPIARNLLAAHPEISAETKQRIIDLVNFHQIPLRWGLAEKPVSEYKKLACRTDIRLLGIFSYFDMLGRICVDHDRVLELAGNFNEVIVPRIIYEMGPFRKIQQIYRKAGLAQKNALWNALKFEDIRLLEKLLKAEPSGNKLPEFQCFITVGVAGSGQAEYLQQLHPQAPVFPMPEMYSDSFTPHQREGYLRQVKHFLSVYGRAGKQLVIEGSNLSQEVRLQITEFARNLGGKVHLLFFDVPFSRISKKIKDPEELQKAKLSHAKLRMPHPWEGHRMDIICQTSSPIIS